MVQDINATFLVARMMVFEVASMFAFLVLALGVAIANYTSSYWYGGYFPFAALGITTGILTLFTLPPMLFISMKRQDAITSMNGVELAWTWFLWILWLSLAASSTGTFWFSDCSTWWIGKGETMCHESQTLTAFSFFTWILLLTYNLTLLFFTIHQHMRGNTSVWTGHITMTDFTASGPNSTGIPPKTIEGENIALL
ncbi:hypothetical protein BDN70DRAFT_897809 [Pholiota conissans]|uniref:MARVEL domain-containing protein n=1 Tax=Pholiota conissans TaxID=109636 RepID=A0A9P5YU53_9AGAR|nr:hypothetical protein BDN70DRAFT_897809 [Pholiota conissans]